MAKKGYYAVQRGRSTGVYSDWDSCKSQISGYAGAVFKRFDTLAEAKNFAASNSGYSSRSPTPSTGSSSSYGGSSYPFGGTYYAPTRNVTQVSPKSFRSTRSNTSSAIKPTNNFYAVKSSNPSLPSKIFNTWNECQSYVRRQRGVSFKKFDNMSAATNYVNGTSSAAIDYNLIGIPESTFTNKYKLPSSNFRFDKTSDVYCDGSSLANGTAYARAGYGVYFEGDPTSNISERLRVGAQTNNRGEIQAVSRALDKIWENLTEKDTKVNYQIKTDSEYVAKLLNDRYSSYSDAELQKVANADLAVPMVKKFAKVKKFYEVNKDSFANNGNFKIEWVRGHAGTEGNEKADALARNGANMN
ncbi:hypothetical protein KAFR_0D01440 [Kazachstania africana CBS 2517]|uniref:Ribonuclease H n=1 Tax=Kazachstania africana (strain ATCC 22294 / BCRC 22015 / CBS 2517 / CECT 1963 / NBRC 1671 / NRRL Y-8276) TaxID=1071382 RepID=H2ATU0_KAZAF|nr:hypothetical protein KAFR_0D01440 [Kazachstania africana CBS 2517]CCF57790.1 hypothetical protein KAFR_0D01440 [Kazachstania africana CBS 2517]